MRSLGQHGDTYAGQNAVFRNAIPEYVFARGILTPCEAASASERFGDFLFRRKVRARRNSGAVARNRAVGVEEGHPHIVEMRRQRACVLFVGVGIKFPVVKFGKRNDVFFCVFEESAVKNARRHDGVDEHTEQGDYEGRQQNTLSHYGLNL